MILLGIQHSFRKVTVKSGQYACINIKMFSLSGLIPTLKCLQRDDNLKKHKWKRIPARKVVLYSLSSEFNTIYISPD